MEPIELRKRAEKLLLTKTEHLQDMSDEEIESLVHNLHAHEIELAMQNEELYKAQEALSDSLARYTNLYHSAPIGYFTLNEKNVIIEANHTFSDLLDLPEKHILQRPFTEFIIQDDQDIFYLLKRRLLEKKTSQHCQLRLKHQKLTTLWVQLDSNTIFNQSDQIQEMRVSVSDITDYQLAKEELVKLSRAVQSSGEGVMIVNINNTIEYINPAFSAITGYSFDEMVGKTPNILNSTIQGPDFYKNMWSTVTSGKIWSGLITDKKKDGTLYPSIMTIAAINDDKDNITHYVVTQKDMTEYQKLEKQFHEAQKMEALGKLTGGIAHDYNNMLAITIGFAALLKDALVGQTKLAKYADEIIHAGERGAKLTSKLLTFSQKNISEAASLNLNALLLMQQHLLEKTLTVRIDLVFKLQENPWSVYLDEGDMEDLILNMSINAMHAIEANGQLTIQTLNQHINQMDAESLNITPGDYVLLSFTDTGCGMDKETKEKIFDPFFTTKGEYGTGLGLSMVYGFVQNSSGIIKVYSEQGQGTQFTLYFPRYYDTDLSQQVDDKNEDEEDFISNKTILIVDDEAALLALMYDILELQGFNIFCAENSTEALSILGHESIDILISDVIMPEINGYQLAAMVKEKYPDIKIQLVSGFTDDRDTGSVNKSLRDNLLQKPFSSQALLQRIRELCDEDL